MEASIQDSCSANPRPLAILTYHQIDATPARGTRYRSLVVAPRDFAQQMRWLRFLGYRGLAMRDMLPYLRGTATGKVVAITFDDGFSNNLQHALPVLLECGFTATCYVVAGRIGGRNEWDASVGVPQKQLMSIGELRAWADAGMEIGAHGLTHADFTKLSVAHAEQEIVGSRSSLQDLLGQPIEHFCYPYGAYNSAHAVAARDAGFATAVTTARGRCHAGAQWWQLPRVPVLRTTSLALLWAKIATRYEDRRSVPVYAEGYDA